MSSMRGSILHKAHVFTLHPLSRRNTPLIASHVASLAVNPDKNSQVPSLPSRGVSAAPPNCRSPLAFNDFPTVTLFLFLLKRSSAVPRAILISEMAPVSSSLCKDPLSLPFPTASPEICGSSGRSSKTVGTRLGYLVSERRNNTMRLMASKEPPGLTKEVNGNQLEALEKVDGSLDPFATLKHRFLRFRRHQFVENAAHFQNLAEAQAPKFLVIACADSRVCPSLILGFQAGEAFIVRNVANLIPPFESGPSETKAALEFAVNSLEVSNILVIGHSRCGGIRALMSMPDEANSNGSFIGEWVVVGKTAKASTRDAVADLSFEHQCRHCEKESINNSILNLLTYPWIEKRVRDGILSIHGGYYDFVDCAFEKWTLDPHGTARNGRQFSTKDCVFWC